jgi:hypothetical protein
VVIGVVGNFSADIPLSIKELEVEVVAIASGTESDGISLARVISVPFSSVIFLSSFLLQLTPIQPSLFPVQNDGSQTIFVVLFD